MAKRRRRNRDKCRLPAHYTTLRQSYAFDRSISNLLGQSLAYAKVSKRGLGMYRLFPIARWNSPAV